MRDRAAVRRSGLAWAGGAAVVAAAAAVTALVVVALFDGREQAPSAPTLSRAVTLRAAPSEDAEAVAPLLLEAGVPVVPAGRSEDGRWLVLDIPGRDVVGWAPADAVANAGDLAALPVVGGMASPTSTPTPTAAVAGPTQTPDLPDLVIEAIFSRENRLVVVVANVGVADVDGPILVIVDGGEPIRVDVSGKPLRAGETLEAVLEQEYVQRRAPVPVEVRPGEGVEEKDADNNRLQRMIAPDVPNDLELLSVELEPELARFAITVRNNGVIPLVGEVTVAVRRTAPASLLIGNFVASLDVEAGGTQVYEREFDLAAGAPALDLASIQVILSTDAINDASARNDIFPR